MSEHMSERWIEQAGIYYVNYQIGKRFFLTFEDFCTVVESGRWAVYMADGMRLPDIEDIKTEHAEVFLNASGNKNQGYSVRVKEDGKTHTIHYGLGMIARQKALSHVKELQLS